MKDNQYTQKSITAINAAQALASEYGNQELSQAHLLAALTDSADNLVYQLLGKMQLDAAAVHSATAVNCRAVRSCGASTASIRLRSSPAGLAKAAPPVSRARCM